VERDFSSSFFFSFSFFFTSPHSHAQRNELSEHVQVLLKGKDDVSLSCISGLSPSDQKRFEKVKKKKTCKIL
jgi:hypothetical protein